MPQEKVKVSIVINSDFLSLRSNDQPTQYYLEQLRSILIKISGIEAIRTQIKPSEQRREITEITNSQNTYRTYG